jgi:hypothetical protein
VDPQQNSNWEGLLYFFVTGLATISIDFIRRVVTRRLDDADEEREYEREQEREQERERRHPESGEQLAE